MGLVEPNGRLFPRPCTLSSADLVEELLARLARGEPVLTVARALELDPKTVRACAGTVRIGRASPGSGRRFWRPVARGCTRAPEADFQCGGVVFRELRAQGCPGSAVQVSRTVRRLRLAAQAAQQATVRFETRSGQQVQVGLGQRRVWIGEAYLPAHLFVFTRGYSRLLYPTTFPHERTRRGAPGA